MILSLCFEGVWASTIRCGLFVWAAKKNSSAVKGKVCIVPYSMVGSLTDKELIDPAQFGVVIADESHNMKTMDAKRKTVCLPLRNAQIAVCLSVESTRGDLCPA